MKKSLLVRLAIMLLIASTLPGCLWIVDDDGHRRGGRDDHQRGDRGEHRGGRH